MTARPIPKPNPKSSASGPIRRYDGPPAFACVSYGSGEVVRVVVSGELDLATAPQLEAGLLAAQRRSSDVVLDLRRLEFMDCSCLSVLAAAATRAHVAEARFRVVRGPPDIDRLLALTAFGLSVDLIHGDEL